MGPRGNELELTLVQGDITRVEAEGVVNPANSLGQMGGGVAGALRRAGGEAVEAEAMALAPIPVGRAVATSAGRLPFRHIIHAPTMERPAMATTADKVGLATRAALDCADETGLRSVALPGMGTGVGGVDPEDASRAMVAAAREFTPRTLRKVVFVAYEEAMVRAFEKQGLTRIRG